MPGRVAVSALHGVRSRSRALASCRFSGSCMTERCPLQSPLACAKSRAPLVPSMLMADSNRDSAASTVKTTLSPGVAVSSPSVSGTSWQPCASMSLACWMRRGTESRSRTSRHTASSSPLRRKPRTLASYGRSLFLHEQPSAKMRTHPSYSSAWIWYSGSQSTVETRAWPTVVDRNSRGDRSPQQCV